MKKILISLSIMAAAAAIVVGATTAYFSDTETSSGNTITAGTIDLQVSTDEGQTWQDDPIKAIVNAEIKPSEWIDVPVWLKNVGMNGGIKDIHFTNVKDNGGVTSEPEREAEGLLGGPVDDLSTQIEVDINGMCIDNFGGENNGPDGKPDTLAQLESHNFKLGELPSVDDLDTPEDERVEKDRISFHINSDADNEYQGDFTTFDIEFSLKQLNAPNDLEEPNLIVCRPVSQ